MVMIIAGCGKDPFKRIAPSKDRDAGDRGLLQESYDSKMASIDWERGIPSLRDCDGALWAGVAAAAGIETDLGAFFYPGAGESHRRPDNNPCWTKEDGDIGSKSTTSNDMLIGKGLGLFMQKDIQRLKDITQYGKDNDWFMGAPSSRIGEVVMKPNVQIIYRRSSGDDPEVPTIHTKVSKDYAYHIQVLLIYWEGEQAGRLSQNAIKRLEDASLTHPADYLFSAVLGAYNGDMDRSIQLLNSGINPSSYVRGKDAENFAIANWLLAAKIALQYSE